MRRTDLLSLYTYLSRVVPSGANDEQELVRLMNLISATLNKEQKIGTTQ